MSYIKAWFPEDTDSTMDGYPYMLEKSIQSMTPAMRAHYPPIPENWLSKEDLLIPGLNITVFLGSGHFEWNAYLDDSRKSIHNLPTTLGYDRNGLKLYEMWYDGLNLHRDNHLPAVINYNFPGNGVAEVYYYHHGNRYDPNFSEINMKNIGPIL